MTTVIRTKVDAEFQNVLSQPDGWCENPITGGRFLKGGTGEDSIAHQKREAEKALLAQEWFALDGPANAPALPVTQMGWEDMRHDHECGLNPLIGFYSRSLSFRDWQVHNHPSFEDFARGLLANDNGHWDLPQRVGPAVLKRYPPRALAGMTPHGYWAPPKEYSEIMEECMRGQSRRAKLAS
jgi:hypothetical protein